MKGSKNKTVLFLGAAPFQVSPILYAKKKNYRVITCDNRPQNPGHKLADQSYNVSTLETEAILKIAQKEKINGILTYGSDVSAITAAVVSEKMGLPTAGTKVTEILTSKALFRQFLKKEQLQNESFEIFSWDQKEAAIEFLRTTGTSKIIKPVDSSGSKGVSLLKPEHLKSTVEEKILNAFEYSHSRQIIIEDHFKKSGLQICGDGFIEKGKLVFCGFGDGYFYDDDIHLAPYAESFPSQRPPDTLDRIAKSIEKILHAVGFQTGVFNLDVILKTNGEPYVIELGPRAGGNFLPLAIQTCWNVDLTEAAVESALDLDYSLNIADRTSKPRWIGNYMIHSKVHGKLKALKIPKAIEEKAYPITLQPYLQAGDAVEPFIHGGYAIAHLLLEFKEPNAMTQTLQALSSQSFLDLETRSQ